MERLVFWICFEVFFIEGLEKLQFVFALVLLGCFVSITDVLMITII